MKTIHILNPAAGQGGASEFAHLENAYVTKAPGDATAYIESVLKDATEDINFRVYGGDGSVNEAVTGILRSGSAHGHLSIVPVGTGNDLVRSVEGRDMLDLDVLTLNDRFAVNAINTGFDLDVVQEAGRLKKKPLISGPLAYILGVVSVFMKKFGKNMKITYTDKDGAENTYEGECTLAVAANGAYYGGGFKASPAADVSDGLIDLMIVKKVTRLQFISLIAGYKKGLHIDSVTGEINKKFKDFILFCKCRSVRFEGITEICADGEIFKTESADIGIRPGALKLITGEREKALI